MSQSSPATRSGPAALSEPTVAVRYRGLLTVAIMLATIMQVLDTTIANVALPNMRGSLGASQDQITWVLTSYIVAAAIMTPVTGWLTNQYGLRRVFITCVVGFVITSMLCGFANDLSQMVIYRVLQGLFGASLVPLSQSVMLDINPKERHGQAMAIWGAGVMIGPIIGPSLGGWLTDVFDWRYVFFVNLPVGILAAIGMILFLPKIPAKKRSFDFLGFAFLSIGIGALQMMLDRGQELDWFQSTEVWIETGLFLMGLWMFGWHITSVKNPFTTPALFKDLNFVTALVMAFAVGAILLAGSALLPPMMQNLLGYPVSTAGLILAPRGVGTMISMLFLGRIVSRIDVRLLVFCGLGLTAWSFHMMTGFNLDMTSGPIISSGVIQGMGLGMVFLPLSTIAYATLKPELRTEASSLFNLLRNIGSSIGISISATELSWNVAINRTEMVNKLTETTPALVNGVDAAPFPRSTFLSLLNSEISQQAYMISYVDDFKLLMIVTLAVMPLVFVIRTAKR